MSFVVHAIAWLGQVVGDRWFDTAIREVALARFRPLAFEPRHLFFSGSSFYFSFIGVYLLMRQAELASVSTVWPWKLEGLALLVQGLLSGDV